MSRKDIYISQPSFGEEEWLALKEPLESGWVTQGPKVREFEKRFAELHGVKHAIATTSATTALHLALLALDVGPGDEVIVPAFTWIATANAALYCGATPVMVDILPDTFNIDPAEVARKLTPRTKAIIPVHLFGLCADMDAIRKAAPGIPLVEDAACAAGAGYKDASAGSLGELGCFSFHPRKSVTTGEGGMVTTNDDALAQKVDVLRNHGASISEEQRHLGARPYMLPAFEVMGFNYRMTDLQGAMGVVQIQKLRQLIDERMKRAEFYHHELKDIPWLKTPSYQTYDRHGWQSYVTMVDESKSPCSRNDMMEYLLKNGIHTRPGTHALHIQTFYQQKYGYAPEDFPVSLLANNASMAIPLHNRMTDDDYQRVVNAIREIANL